MSFINFYILNFSH